MNLASIPFSQVLLGVELVALLSGCRLVLGKWVAAALVVLPVAALLPWRTSVYAWHSSAVLPAGAAVIWLWWLAAEREGKIQKRLTGVAGWAIAAAAASGIVQFAPQALIVLAAAAAYRAARASGARRLVPVAALFVAPLCSKALILVAAAAATGYGHGASYWLGSNFLEGWASRSWFEATGSYAFLNTQAEFNTLFWLPMALPVAAIGFAWRRRWWFAPTFLWAAVLLGGTLALERNLYLQFSLPMQMALLVPAGLIAVEMIRECGKVTADAAPNDARGTPAE